MVRAWARRTVELQRELAAIAELDPRWWLLAGGVAFAETHAPPQIYLASDAEADADTFMGYPAPQPRDLVADAIQRAHAARAALRELDGTLPDQPLAVTIERSGGGQTRPSALDVAAFAIGRHCVVAQLDDPTLAARLAAMLDGAAPTAWDVLDGAAPTQRDLLDGAAPTPWRGATPFVCVSIGDEPIDTARHGHRRAWTERGGPWLGLSRAGDVAIVSTCHLVIDGYGHARVTARIAERMSEPAHVAERTREPAHVAELVIEPARIPANHRAPALSAVAGAVPLAIAWRELAPPTPRLIPLAYQLGCMLHEHAGARDARFSPTIQIPVARGHKDDPDRLRRRIVSSTTSVRFARGVPEPFAAFEARVRDGFAREAAGRGLVSRLLAAARAVPVPLAWKRRSISAKRAGWLERFAEVIGGRALLSRIAVDTRVPPLCAVSSPSRLASDRDPIGGCVITIVDDGHRAAITVCGSGFAGTAASASAFLDRLLASVEAHADASRVAL